MSYRRVPGQLEGRSSPRARRPSSAERRNARRAALADDFGFTYGFFFVVMPVSAIVIASLGVVAGIVTPLEALLAVGATSLWVALEVYDSRGAQVGRMVGALFDPVVKGMIRFFVALAPYPVVGRIAEFAGMTMVLWLPGVILAVVRLASRM